MASQLTDSVFEEIVAWFRQNGSGAIVALSGGVDSAVVALAAKQAFGSGALAITADYKTLSAEELEYAKKVAREIGIEHKIIEYSELDNPQFVRNDSERCYHCRAELGKRLLEESRKHSITLIVDGTNADDLQDYRPGIRAMREAGVKSPLAELGIYKATVRQIAKSTGLSVHDKPSNACLASRIPRGMEVTMEKLGRIEQAEMLVKSVTGARQVRVRDHGDLARIEVGREELAKVFDTSRLAALDAGLRALGYQHVTIDAAGYRAGNLVVLSGGLDA